MSATDAEHVRKHELPKSKHKAEKRCMKFCPKCGAVDVFWASGLPQLWSIWECRNYGHRGAFIIEDDELAEKLREKYASKNVKK